MYFGFASLRLTASTIQNLSDGQPTTSSSPTVEVFPSVLSIGYNPFYKNTVRSVEIHILHDFDYDFYGASLNVLMLGFVRPEYDYASLEALIDDIQFDCEVAKRSLSRPTYDKYRNEEWLRDFSWVDKVDTAKVEAEVLAKQNSTT